MNQIYNGVGISTISDYNDNKDSKTELITHLENKKYSNVIKDAHTSVFNLE